MEDFLNQPKPKKPVPVAATKLPADEDEEEENWENDLLEHSYNPLEVTIRSLTFVICLVTSVCRPAGRRMC